MFERAYRQRLESDLAAWQRDGIVPPTVGDSIRARLGPIPQGVNIPTVVAILGALLIAAAFLTFVAANWEEIPRAARFTLLLAGIAVSYALATWFDRTGRSYLADVCVTVGSIVFGAAIALTGQMYHLGGDFAAGVLLWAGGALLAAALTGSRGALAVALSVGCFWSAMRMEALREPHFPFLIFWFVAAALAAMWNSAPARHLAALAALAWWIMVGVHYVSIFNFDPLGVIAGGGALMFGAGLVMANVGNESLRRFGATFSSYGVLAFVVIVAFTIVGIIEASRQHMPSWVLACGIAGILCAAAAAIVGRSVGAAVAVIAVIIGIALEAGALGSIRPRDQPWLAYALVLIAMLSLVISGMLDDIRPRVVAGWIGLATALAAITWAIEGSLIARALFLALAGAVAVALAVGLGRFKFKERVA